MMRFLCRLLVALLFCSPSLLFAQKKNFQLSSPDGNIKVELLLGEQLQWQVKDKDKTIIAPSSVALYLQKGEILGENVRVKTTKVETVHNNINAINYKKAIVADNYNELTVNCVGDFGVIFRAYNDGVAYRFFTNRKDSIVVRSERADFHFADDDSVYIPYISSRHNNDNFQNSFENLYQHIRLSEIVKDTLAFAPVLVEMTGGKKAVITEADLEEYPGMFLKKGSRENLLSGSFAAYPAEEIPDAHNEALLLVAKRADYIAKIAGTRTLPWRVVIITQNDSALLNNDMVYRLASPSRIKDISWIKPGKAAWDWWNDWNLSHVDFKASPNTATYKYYIDFAAANNLEYSMIDASWSDSKDLMKISPDVNLKEVIDYAASKKVGVWLWAGSLPMQQKMDEVLQTYSKMGVKGFKVDFFDRDDQKIVNFYYRLAKKAADNHLMIDYHGIFKPTGIQRTYPNVVNFEGVRGMEYAKWSYTDPNYDATIPFIRMIAGPMDYTPGAMKNANKENFRSINASPMSAGTRCHQLAMYIIFEAPLAMLSDNPVSYLKEKESTSFISSIPTVFDETIALGGKVGEFAAIARRKDKTWFVGAMGNWNLQDQNINLSFLGNGNFEAEIFSDGINADKEAMDYKRQVIKVSSKDNLPIHLAKGGGWAAKIYRVQ